MTSTFPVAESTVTKKELAWRVRLAFWTRIATLAVALPALAGFAARWWWVFELASHFRVQYFWGLLATLLASLIARRRWLALVSGALLIVHAGLLWPFLVGGDNRPGQRSLKIVSLNLNARNPQHERVLDYIRETSPDVAVFLEVSEAWGEVLTALDDGWPHSRTRAQRGFFGVALYSKLPLDESRIEFLENGIPAIAAQIRVEGDGGQVPVTIFGAHPIRPVVGLGDAARNRQLGVLADLVAAQSGAKLVIGDLNTTSWSPGFTDFAERSGLRDSRVGLGVQPSWPAFLPAFMRIPIDHCLVSPEIEVVGRRIGPDVGSDHLPVIVNLTINSAHSSGP